MRPQDVFEITLERVRECQEMLKKIGTINPAASVARQTKRRGMPTPADFVADFEMAGKEAIRRRWPGKPKRMHVFRLYYLADLKPHVVIERLKLNENTFWGWKKDIAVVVGYELRDRGVFPPGRYFREPMWMIELRREEGKRRRFADTIDLNL